jgi:hypothetical protein
VFREDRITGYSKNGKPKIKTIRGFRAPRPGDSVEALVLAKLEEAMPRWQASNIVPDEAFPSDTNDDRPRQYGAPLWRDLFNPRQLYGHCVSVEVFHQMVDEYVRTDLDRAAMVYIALAIDKMVYYNAIQCHWDGSTGRVRSVFDRHDFSFKWSYAEMASTIADLGYDWAIEQTAKAVCELIELLGQASDGKLQFATPRPKPRVQVICSSGDTLPLLDASVDCVVMDPPYYDNVMYAELSGFFYVWLKRTAGLLYPELFTSYLPDTDHEAVANPARFKGQKGGAKNLAGRDSAPNGSHLQGAATGIEVGRHHDRHVHPQSCWGLGCACQWPDRRRLYHHGFVADQHGSRRKPAHSGEIRSALNNLSCLPGARSAPEG